MSTNDTTKVYIYGLKEKGADDIRYIGHSKNPKRRLQEHKAPSGRKTGNEPFNAWLDKVGDKLTYAIIDRVPASQARKYEEKYIRMWSIDHNLLNKRQAARKVYTSEQAHQILNTMLGDSIK